MTDRNRSRGSRSDSGHEEGMLGSSGSQREPMSGSSGRGGSVSDRSSSNIGSGRNSESGTSGSREESMRGSASRNQRPDQLGDERDSGDERGSMHGSSSGTTGLGGERKQTSTGSPGGVEGMTDKSNPNPDEDLSRNR